ncbi:hypothetical protein FRC00_003786, partial [Tulasnella sp. 408]
QALFTPELLSLVFSFFQSADLATSARVCKWWSDTALNELWRDLYSVFPLLELVLDLSLIKEEITSSMFEKLNEVLADADWNRFRSYATRVRSLRFDENEAYRSDPHSPDLDSPVVGILSLHHPFGTVFLPHLQKLNWITERSAPSILPFLSSELKELYLEMSTQTASTANTVFKAINNRTPSLITFYLQAKVQGISVDTSLARWLQTAVNIEEISVPPHYLTPTLTRALGSLPKLRSIKQSLNFTHSTHPSAGLQSLPPGSFPKLSQISFNATPSEAGTFLFTSQEIASRLDRIVLFAYGSLETEDILKFAQLVAQSCPMITELALDLFTIQDSGEQSVSSLPMTVLESLYPCTRCRSLEIGHPFPLTFQEEDVERMGRAWPQLTTLDVCSDPDFSFPFPPQVGSPLSILSVFAKALPRLKVLSLYLNMQEAPLFTGNLWPQHQFQNLEEVDFGLSPVPRGPSREVGFYVASLCKERPTVAYGASSWHTGNLPNDWTQTETAWKEIDDMLGFAMGVKRAGLSSLRESATQ